jgi:replicative DNA helicase
MANVFETRLLEQSLLKLLSQDKMTARIYMHRANIDMFVTSQRKFIYDRMQRLFSETAGLMTDALFEFDVKQSVPDDDQDSYMAEWTVICGLDVEESPEAILDALEKALLAQKVSTICRDVATLIQGGSVEEAVNKIRSETVMLGSKNDDIPTIEIVDHLHRVKLIQDKQENPLKFLGIKTGFPTYDLKTGGLFPAEVTLVSAVTGVGKSTFMKAVAANVVSKAQKNVLHITNEESRAQVEMKYDALISGIDYFSFKNATISPNEVQVWEDSINELKKTNKHGRLFIKEIPHFDNCLAITRTYYELEQLGYKIDLIVIDYMDHLLPVVKSWSENDEQGKVAADIKALAVSLNIPVMTATQAATAAEAKQEKGRSFGKLDVYGSKRKVHSCNNLVFVIQEGRDISQLKPPTGKGTYEDERECDCFWLIEVAKNRDGAPFFFKARQFVHTGRVEQINNNGAIVNNVVNQFTTTAVAAKNEASEDFDATLNKVEQKESESSQEVFPETFPETTTDFTDDEPVVVKTDIVRKKRS